MSVGMALSLKGWIDEHRQLLKPPVGNKMIWEDHDFIVMVVGGPNSRKDYHINQTEEFFYQIEGDITVKIVEDGSPRDVPVREGDVFLLPAGVPHSPQRPENTIGIVVERQRPEGVNDHCVWYCESCGHVLHDAEFQLKHIATQLKTLLEDFFANEALRTCSTCGVVMAPPAPAK